MKKHILVGTHHKTGTVWMHSVFHSFCKMQDIPFYDISEGELGPTHEDKLKYLNLALEGDKKVVIYDYHSKFPLDALTDDQLDQFSGIHIVRDPRDLIISSAKYHCWSEEAWLHEPSSKFGGQTYQETINSLSSMEEKMLFEMDNSAGGQIQIMVRFNGRGVVRTHHYERLMQDHDLLYWHNICIELGLEGEEILSMLESFWDNSLFGGKGDKSRHIQDGSVTQYLGVYNEALNAEFMSRFAEHLEILGYNPI